MAVNRSNFKRLTQLGSDLIEVESIPSRIHLDIPIQLGIAILNYAKLHMLQFYYNFMLKYFQREKIELCEMDTDSFYFALAGKDLQDIVKPEMKEKLHDLLYGHCGENDFEEHYLLRQCCQKCKKYDARKPGCFKVEATGNAILSLCSKSYILQNDKGEFKIGCKGVQKARLLRDNPMQRYRDVLENKVPCCVSNMGFRLHGNSIHTYEQQKIGLAYFYVKREVCNDGRTTKPLQLTLIGKKVPKIYCIQSEAPVLNSFYCHNIWYEDTAFKSGEHLFNFLKAKFHHASEETQLCIQEAISPAVARKLGNKICINNHWVQYGEYDAMLLVCKLKFEQQYLVREALRKSNDRDIVHADPYDSYFGITLSKFALRWVDPMEYPGRNVLGKIWMHIRLENEMGNIK